MENEYMRRGYLLPKGCKDLIDVLYLKGQARPVMKPTPLPTKPLPPVNGVVVLPGHTTVLELAAKLEQKPFRIVADLMEFGVFATVKQALDFNTLSKVTRKYGFRVKNAG